MKIGSIIKNNYAGDKNPYKYSIYTGKRRGRYHICLALDVNTLVEVECDLRDVGFESIGESYGWELIKKELKNCKEEDDKDE